MRVSARAAQALATSSGGSKRKSLGSSRRESELQAAVLTAVNLIPGVVMWKSGAGAFRMTYNGKTRFVRMGRKGVSDLIGWRIVMTADHDDVTYCWPQPIARLAAIEVKRPGKHATPEQQSFLDLVKRDGGIGGVAHSVEEAVELLR